jgi:predicted ester cyclase
VSSEAEQNKILVRRLFEARAKLDLEALDKVLAADFVSHTTRVLPGQPLDREAYKRMTLEYAAALSNTSFTVEEQVAEADKVVTRFTVHAAHDRKAFLGVAPTGRETSYNAIFIHRIEGGKIAEERSLGTVAQTMMEQRLEQERIERERIEQELKVAQVKELAPYGCPALALTPGWLRLEMMLDAFGVGESNCRDAIAAQPHFAISETPRYVGRAVAHLATDPEVGRFNGHSLSSGELAKEYGFTDLDASQQDAWRYLVEVQDAGQPADTTGYR